MKFSSVVSLGLACLLAGLVSGCSKKPEVTSLQRKEAATHASEAEFAVLTRDHARAEDLYAKATKLCPDMGEYWVSLGSVQARQGKKPEAKKAYEAALAAYKDIVKAGGKTAAKEAKSPGANLMAPSTAALQQVVVLALLGRVEEARALQAKLPEQFAGDRNVKEFVEQKALDNLMTNPQFKEVAL